MAVARSYSSNIENLTISKKFCQSNNLILSFIGWPLSTYVVMLCLELHMSTWKVSPCYHIIMPNLFTCVRIATVAHCC